MAIIIPKGEDRGDLTPICNYCGKVGGIEGRYLLHHTLSKLSICNYCVTLLYNEVVKVEALRNMPTHGAPN